MPGSMPDNLRRAYLKEELGVYLLRGFAAVAPVPRPQDVGIDAIATLLNRANSVRLIAEDSFFVQLKSQSVDTITFEGDQLTWFRQLEIPFFVGIISEPPQSISLYTSHSASSALLENDYESITLHWETEDHPPFRQGHRDVNLGAPVLRWSVAESGDPSFVDRAYAVMKPWVTVERRNIITRRARIIEGLRWETNEPPIHNGTGIFSDSVGEQNLQNILEEMTPYLNCWLSDCLAKDRIEDTKFLITVRNLMRERGVDPDYRNTWDAYVRIMEERAQAKAASTQEDD